MDSVVTSVYNKNRIKRYFFLIFGVLVCACSYNLFILPYDIVFGGVGGISIIISHFLHLNISLIMLCLSFFMFLLGLLFLPKELAFKSLLGAILQPIFIELTSFLPNVIPVSNVDMLVVCLFGGTLYGIGVGIVMKNGFTLGGTDFLTEIVHKYMKFTMGTSMLIIEGSVVVSGAFIFGVTNFLYALIILYLITFFVDKVILGISDKKAFYIITKKKDEVSKYVIDELGHTITIFDAKGGFSNKKVFVLFTVIPTSEYYKLKEGISHIDSGAFFTVVDAYEVSGGE